jgi:predicted ArsR family transcriptional regulator
MNAARKLRIHRPVQDHDRNVFQSRHPKFLAALVRAGANGLTAEELARIVKAKDADARGRCRELVVMGYAENSGSTRLTTSGRRASVWRVTRSGKLKALQLRGT